MQEVCGWGRRGFRLLFILQQTNKQSNILEILIIVLLNFYLCAMKRGGSNNFEEGKDYMEH